MCDVLIKNAKTLNGEQIDIAIIAGKIDKIGTQLTLDAKQVIDVKGQSYVSAGWIDLHTHCYANSPIYHDTPDRVGVSTGVTTVVDAGSVGANDVDDFYQLSQLQKTNVYSLLNISKIGLLRQNELADLNDLDEGLVSATLQRHGNFVVGLKARMSGSVVENNGIEPLKVAKRMQANNGGLPLMVHIGNTPPKLDDVVDLLGENDVVTHCYNGKPNKIFTPQGQLKSSVQAAMERGMKLDVGHGGASFSFDVAEKAIAQGIYPDTISSDIYCKNRELGPVRSLAHIMTKFLNIGLSVEQIIDCVTINAAQMVRFTFKGQLAEGFDADLTFFNIESQQISLEDCEQQTRQATQQFMPVAAMVAGELTITDYGVQLNVFNS
ncbi:amidohydrolase/deacetylase family metallohydrolase [Vibrio sp. S11_S32]|uniref:amidohydrolase/deacetylase family metallohydrolase n=1 Tax=Vibrio sp. S11_S32 TaxID=2720225 RepID=UPI00167FEF47|nr:amidohydrolase/deacetylase family metallohydrolase [Vibrio sp. S11_S32]MBD1576499.1 amidohydrolase/deacetylase family metallohydrolase [Vibrio sp. S11_S32]